MKKILNFRAIPILLLAMLIGILVVGLTSFWWWLGVVFAVVTVLIFIKFTPKHKKIFSFSLFVAVIFLIISLITFGQLYRYKNLKVESNVVLEGNVDISSASESDGKIIANGYTDYIVLENLTANNKKIKGKAEIRVTAEISSQLYVGDRLSVPCVIEKLTMSPKVSKSVNKYFDKIYWKAVADDYEEGRQNYIIIKQAPKASDQIKLFQKKNLFDSTDEITASFLYAMTFGGSSEIPFDVRANFSQTGTAHLFAVSGLHIGIIAGAIILFLKKCKLNNYWQCGITMPILIFFCWLCGFSSSSCRATLMIFVAMIAKTFGRRNDILSTISFSAMLLLIIQPLYCFDLSFQLSYFAVYGLIFIGTPLTRILGKVLPKWMAKGLGASIGANVALLPLMLIYFNNLSFLFIIANLITIPLISIFFPIYLLCSLIGAIPFMNFLLTAIVFLFKGIVLFVGALAKVKFLKISIAIAWWVMIPHICFMIFVSDYCLITKKFKTAVAITSGCLVAFSCILSMRGVIFPQSEVYTIQDKNGNSYISFDLANDGDYLVLTDQTSYDGLMVIKEFYYKKGIQSLKGVVLCENQKETKYLNDFLARMSVDCLYSRAPDVRIKNYVNQFYSSRLISDNLSISFLDGNNLQVDLDGVRMSIYPNDYISYSQIDCDILFGENKNPYSNIKKYIVDDNITMNSEKLLSWGCLFNIKNGKIKAI